MAGTNTAITPPTNSAISISHFAMLQNFAFAKQIFMRLSRTVPADGWMEPGCPDVELFVT
jgi:hypothetical protein